MICQAKWGTFLAVFYTFLADFCRREKGDLGRKSPEKGQEPLVDFLWIQGLLRVALQEVGWCSENHYKKDQTGHIPLPGTSLIMPVEHPIKEPSDQAAFLRFLMISEINFTPAGKMLMRKITRMYLVGSSFPT
jgi:hypothetical protein